MRLRRSAGAGVDSTQIASNIVVMSRLQLTVEAIQRLHRLLDEADRQRYAEWLEPYVGETAGHYVHRVKGRVATDAKLQLAGQVLYQLLQAMADGYGQEPAYQVAVRLFGEQYRLQAETAQPKANSEISANSLQSLDDLEATYREKNRVGYKGYVANVTETCDPANSLQLITAVQVAPNTAEDGELLAAVLPSLEQRTGLDTLYTDGAYGGPLSEPTLREQQVTLIQTAMIGSEPAPEWLHLADFAITQDAQGRPLSLTCPQGQTVPITPSRNPQRFAVNLAGPACATCPLYLAGRCPPQPDKHYRTFRLTFTRADIDSAQRRRRSRALRATGRNPRAAVESTVRSLKRPFPAGKLPVRGLFRMTCLIVASAAMTNVRRIQRYLQTTRPQGPERRENRDQLPFNPVTDLLASRAAAFCALLHTAFLPLPAHALCSAR